MKHVLPCEHFLLIFLAFFLSNMLLANEWVSHHNLTPTAYQQKFDELKLQGFRLIQVDGYRVGTEVFYAAIWEKSAGPAYVTHHGLSSSDYQAKFNFYKRRGYRLVLVDGGGGNTAFYSAIWERRSGPRYISHHGMSGADYQQKFDQYKQQGYRLTWISAYGVGNSAQFAAIWEQTGGPAYIVQHGMSSSDYQMKFDQYTAQGYRLKQVSGYNLGNTDYYAAIWEQTGGPAWQARHGLSSLGYQNEFDNHRYTGFRLLQVSGYARNGQATFAGLWESNGDWTDADRATINESIEKFMNVFDVVGTSFALIKDERLIYARGYGMLDQGTGVPVGPTTLFRVASVSKPITGVAMMKLAESNSGLLGEEVFGSGDILGTTYGSQSYGSWEQQVTVQHLIEHTAGGNQWDNDGDDGAGDPMFQQLGFDHAQLIGWVLDNRNPEGAPGTIYDYSNFGYCVAGRVIEQKSGKTYENYVRDHVFQPCGVSRLYIAGDLATDRRYNEVTYYNGSPYSMKVARMDAHGGWLGTAFDLARFLVRVDGKALKPDIISGTSYTTMTTPVNINSGYAKGWSVNGSNYFHNGSFDGSGAIIVQAGNGLSWVFLMNRRWEGTADGLIWDIVNNIAVWPSHDYDAN